MTTAICPGSFDPPTNGHLNIIERATTIFDRVIVAVAINASKAPIFTADERVAMLREIFADKPNILVDAFTGLMVDYARQHNVRTILRGIRNLSDYEYESQLALANKAMSPGLETIFLMAEGRYAHISSSIIKDVVRYRSNASGMIHPIVERRLREKFCE